MGIEMQALQILISNSISEVSSVYIQLRLRLYNLAFPSFNCSQ